MGEARSECDYANISLVCRNSRHGVGTKNGARIRNEQLIGGKMRRVIIAIKTSR